jgi:hypothetical protein
MIYNQFLVENQVLRPTQGSQTQGRQTEGKQT